MAEVEDWADVRSMSEREFLIYLLWLIGQRDIEVEEYRRIPVTRTLHLDLWLREHGG